MRESAGSCPKQRSTLLERPWLEHNVARVEHQVLSLCLKHASHQLRTGQVLVK